MATTPKKRETKCGTDNHVGQHYMTTACLCACHMDRYAACDLDSRKGK